MRLRNSVESLSRGIRLHGELPNVLNLPSGCVFHTRCPRKLGAICAQQEPPFLDAGHEGDPAQPTAHRIRCHIPVATLRALQTASRDTPDEGPGDALPERSANAPQNARRNE